MAYIINYSFEKTLANDTLTSIRTPRDKSSSIQITASVTDGGGTAVPGQILQFYAQPLSLVVMSDDNKALPYDRDYGSYLIKDDGAGNYSFWIAATQKTIVSTGFAVQDAPESAVEAATVLFSSYMGLTTKYGPPVLPLDANGVIQLSNTDPYITVGLPQSTQIFADYASAQVALLINGTQFVSGSFKTVFNEGFQVPTNMLDPAKLNRFGYTIVNGDTSIAPVAPSVPVNGEIISRPQPSVLRTLTQSPYILNHAEVINDASQDITVFIDCPTANPDNIQTGDTVELTVYVNAWQQASNKPNNTIFTVKVPPIGQGDIGNPLTASIPAGKLAGFGMNASGRPGEIYIDYTLTKNGDTKVSAMPQKYFTGYINTVGPI